MPSPYGPLQKQKHTNWHHLNRRSWSWGILSPHSFKKPFPIQHRPPPLLPHCHLEANTRCNTGSFSTIYAFVNCIASGCWRWGLDPCTCLVSEVVRYSPQQFQKSVPLKCSHCAKANHTDARCFYNALGRNYKGKPSTKYLREKYCNSRAMSDA